MKRAMFLTFFILFFIANANCQITKGNWLVGGTGSFSMFKVLDEKSHYLQLSPNIGYFVSDKFAAGLKPSYTYNKVGGDATFSAKSSGFYIGPFARYYFLSSEKQFNILLEGAYQHGFEKLKGYSATATKYSLNTFSFAAGPVLYFNSSVGLEFLFGYNRSKYTGEDFYESQLQISLGLQFHLEKE